MIVVVGTVRVPAESIDGLKPAMNQIIAASRNDTGCVSYSFGLDPDDPGLIHISEEWETMEALTAHLEQPHMGPWREALGAVGVLDRKLTVYQADDGRTL